MDTTYWKEKVQRDINELHKDRVKECTHRVYRIIKDIILDCEDKYATDLQDIYDTWADGVTYKEFIDMELVATVEFKYDLEDRIKELINEAF